MADALKDAKDVFVNGGGEALRAAVANVSCVQHLEPVEAAPIDAATDLLTPRRFNSAVVPPKPHPVFSLEDKIISTPGNITVIQGAPKLGKSSLVAAFIAAPIADRRQGPDTLGILAENPDGKALVHLDTEQSAYDHDQLVRRALKRAWVGDAPPWLMSYCVTDLSIADRKKALESALEQGEREHGGIFAIIIDGIADLCASPNDEAESFALVAYIMQLAARYKCTVVVVLHENPGSEIGKTRGHLGSELERKSETPLRLAKDSNGITTMWSEKARHCYLPKEQGTCFQWSDEAGMHVSCGDAREIRSTAAREKMQAEAASAFGSEESLNYGALKDAIGEALTLQERASKKRIQLWCAEGVITKQPQGFYVLTD